MSKTQISIREAFAEYLTKQEEQVTQHWLELLRRASDIDHARALPVGVLIDHLPDLYAGLCEWIRVGQRNHLNHEARDDARQHGAQRWKIGFRLEEVLRELDLLRAVILIHVVDGFRQECRHFPSARESELRFSIEEYFSRISGWSIRRYVAEHEESIAAYIAQLEESNRALRLAASQQSHEPGTPGTGVGDLSEQTR